jgi:GT2 family glycosyltransferase
VQAPVTAIIVCSFEEPASVRRTVESLLAQTRPPAEIIVADNHPEAVVSRALEAEGLPIRALPTGANLGFPQACNFAAPYAQERWLFFLNPDAHAEPECLERLLEATDADDVAITGAQVLLADGVTVNAGDNPIHISALSWAGHYLEPREEGPPREAAGVSGAALLARADVFAALGGHCPGFFLYHDDLDICWRARIGGWRVLYVPRAVILHDYVFEKGSRKWYELEHNRLWTLLCNYEVRTLVLLAPVLVAAEIGIAVLARRDGWWDEKRRGWSAVVRERRAIRRWRAHVQATRRLPDAVMLERMTGRLDTPLVRAPGTGVAGAVLDTYRRVLVRLTG